MNLKDRLRLIKTTGGRSEAKTPESGSKALPASSPSSSSPPLTKDEPPAFSGWHLEGDFVQSRTVILDAVTLENTAGSLGMIPIEAVKTANFAFSIEGLSALLPDIGRFLDAGNTLKTSGLTFFDLETTGLSGGAGTVAFLAAFGEITRETPPGNRAVLTVTQYLLLDYPGEPLFLQKCREHLSGLVVTYNGKSFDSQIIKNRCVMNALSPPFYHHADLVHPARYLWKRKLPSCRQRDIEKRVLGLDRGDDLPGSAAPDAWFHFLKSGETERLLKICAHNAADIAGLAAIWDVFVALATTPLSARRYDADLEHLALRYHNFVKRRRREDRPASLSVEETAVELLEQAAAHGGEIARLLWKRKYGSQLF
ncbi:MAG: ribonuclease H-like domain-containing protein [Spirochaetaceae bacterium]|jgi:uncharacterized protein YprB with RNaseH-like and TPR domain|nr:ribonuclease H-like domain-containing protein [Spirochaetaceae bacterium]